MSESSSVSGFTYRAFISYSHRDKTWGDWLHKALETYRVPSRLVGKQTEAGTIPRRLHPVFRDREELASATDLGRKVNEALAQSETMVVICSPASAASRWVNEEVLAYKRMGRGERIFCLIVAGEPNAIDLPGREAEECFCPALRFKLDANGQTTHERTEPIAADAREGKDGRTNAKLKLIAGMLGVGFDALKQRELQRRTRRMTAIAALALIVMAATSVLAVYAFISRHQAVAAEHQAQVAQQAAERRQKQAEGLVGFMLGDLNDKLAQVQRLDIMQSVDDKAMAYFQSLPNTDVTPAALAGRAKTLEKIATVRLNTGNLPGALAAYQASAKLSSKLAAAKPSDSARQIAYSRTLAFIGLVHWNQGKLEAAQQDFESAQLVLQAAQKRASYDPSLLIQLTYLSDDIGHVLEAQGQPDAAEIKYRKMLALTHQLIALQPDNTQFTSELGIAHNNLGKLALLRGDLATAVAEYRADNVIETRLAERDPKDNSQRENMLRVRAIMGLMLAMAGDTETGMHDLQQSVEGFKQLAQFDPHDTAIQDKLAVSSSQLARLQRLSDNLSGARALTTRSIAILSGLTSKDPSNNSWQRDFAKALTEQAAESLAANQTGTARTLVQRAAQILEPMRAKHPDERSTLLATITAKLLLADTSTSPQIEQILRKQALRTAQAVKINHDDPRLLALQVEAQIGLGNPVQTQRAITRLQASGYRDPSFVALLRRARVQYQPVAIAALSEHQEAPKVASKGKARH